jgi:hypothetical protein
MTGRPVVQQLSGTTPRLKGHLLRWIQTRLINPRRRRTAGSAGSKSTRQDQGPRYLAKRHGNADAG